MTKSRRIRSVGNAARMANRIAYRLLVGKPEGKGPLERPRRRWVDNIKMDLGEILSGGMDWINLESKALSMIVDAPWYVPNTVIRRNLQIQTVKVESRRYRFQY
jgi:hypothetical protein